jgi:hypothetical protein
MVMPALVWFDTLSLVLAMPLSGYRTHSTSRIIGCACTQSGVSVVSMLVRNELQIESLLCGNGLYWVLFYTILVFEERPHD